MSEGKGILFKPDMVRAILEGRKTQTRRLVKFPADTPVNELSRGEDFMQNLRPMAQWTYFRKGENVSVQGQRCIAQIPYPWQVGDILYVKETWGVGTRPDPYQGAVSGIEYRADEAYLDQYANLRVFPFDDFDYEKYEGRGWRSSMFMPKAIARIWLKVTNVRVERLLDISEADAIAEGVVSFTSEKGLRWKCYETDPENNGFISARLSYMSLWDFINGAGSHEVNPYVFVIEFERIEKP